MMLKELLKAFKGDSLLDKAYQQSYEMLQITKDMVEEGINSLRERDHSKLDTTIYAKDIAVNKYERSFQISKSHSLQPSLKQNNLDSIAVRVLFGG